MSYETYKYENIRKNNDPNASPWIDFDGGQKFGINGLDHLTVGINFREEIEARWGQVDIDKYYYCFGLMFRRRNSLRNNAYEYYYVGASTSNTNPLASQNVDPQYSYTFGGLGNSETKYYNMRIRQENQGIVSGQIVCDSQGFFNTGGAMQNIWYAGLENNRFQFNGENYSDFAGPPTDNTAPYIFNVFDTIGTYQLWRFLFQDYGNVSYINTKSLTEGMLIPETYLNSNNSTYFWLRMNTPVSSDEGKKFGISTMRPEDGYCFSMGFSTDPYFKILENVFPSSRSIVDQAVEFQMPFSGIVQLGCYAPNIHQGDPNNWNPYYDGNLQFEAFTTYLYRIPRTWDNGELSIWNDYDHFTLGAYTGASAAFIDWRKATSKIFFNMARFNTVDDWKSYTGQSIQEETIGTSLMMNDSLNFGWGDQWLDGVKGVGNFLLMSASAAAKCLNMTNCATLEQLIDPTISVINCSTLDNASECVRTNPTEGGFLGWSGIDQISPFCAREPDDVLCGCVNTVNDANIQDFIIVFKQITGLDLPAYCFTDACTDPLSNAWIDPRIDFTGCPDGLTFCLSLIDIAGDNNTITNTQIYQDCSKEVGDQTSKGASTTSYIILGVVFGVILIGLIIFFVMRSRSKAKFEEMQANGQNEYGENIYEQNTYGQENTQSMSQ